MTIENPMNDFRFTFANCRPSPPSKASVCGFGECGFAAKHYTPQQQDEKSREVLKAALRWGCPFVLYWEMYNSEVKDRKQIGYWLIGDKNVKQPVYCSHRRLCVKHLLFSNRLIT